MGPVVRAARPSPGWGRQRAGGTCGLGMAENRAATVVFTTLAMNQTLFFEALARALEAKGVAAAHIAFHERSHEYLTRRGQLSFNAFAAAPDGAVDWHALGIDN